jgi:hypothetical protein
MNPITLRAHFDGKQIVLDEPANLKPDTQLIVTVLPISKNNGETGEIDEEREDWIRMSLMNLENAYPETFP